MIFECSKEVFSIEINGRQIEVKIRKSSRARNIVLKVNIRGQVELVLPKRASFSKARQFLEDKLPWIIKRINAVEKNPYANLSKIPIFDEHYVVEHTYSDEEAAVTCTNNVIKIISHPNHREVVLVQYLKNLLLKEIENLVRINSISHNLRFHSVRLGKGVSTWGSCSKEGKLSFNWRLIFASKQIMYYLVAHEMAHLKERNHGPKFWHLVKSIYPDSDIARKWLKKEGRGLFQILENHK